MSNHNGVPIWEVEIPVAGNFALSERISINARKEIETSQAFYSNVRIMPKEYGALFLLTAFAPNSEQAKQVGLVFLGRMLDVLSLDTGIALSVFDNENFFYRAVECRAKPILNRDSFVDAFNRSRILALSDTTYLRALGWFRKGLNTSDPLDRFLSFWIPIETVASKYNPNKERCSDRGSICHIWECFKYVWGDCSDWPIIGGDSTWIDNGNRNRVAVAHGTISPDVESVADVYSMLSDLESVSRQFLKDWYTNLPLDADTSRME